MSELRVSVVVATRDRADRLGRLLGALAGQTLDRSAFEVIIVDDGSQDGTAAVLAAATPDVRVVRSERSRGPAAARNEGWRAARAPLVAFTDDDCQVTDGWLEALLKVAEAHPGAIVQGPVTPHPDERDLYGPFSHTLENESLGRGFETANILYPRDLLEHLGGFDETAFSKAGGEDTDLAWRAIEAGTQPYWAPQAMVHHSVVGLGPLGKLRSARRWDESMLAFRRHPALRRTLVAGVFWNRHHLEFTRAVLALALPRRLWWLRWMLAAPYVAYLVERRSGPLLAPYLVLYDAIEVATVLQGAARYRVLVI